MKTHWQTIKKHQDKEFAGYVSLPPAGTGPGLLLLQEIWGVNEHIKTVADQYAMSGYVVMAPDIFWRLGHRIDLEYNEAGNLKAFDYMNRLDFAQAADDLTDAVKILRSLPAVKGKVGVVGYCMGGQLAYRTAALSDVDAAVCYYGGGIDRCLELATNINKPIMFHYANDDQHISQESRQKVKDKFANKSHAVFFDYPDTDHGFNCWGRPTMYNQKAAALAQGRTLEFLAKNL